MHSMICKYQYSITYNNNSNNNSTFPKPQPLLKLHLCAFLLSQHVVMVQVNINTERDLVQKRETVCIWMDREPLKQKG